MHGLLQRVILAIFLLAIFVHVQAAPADIARGLTWLQGQVSSDGQIALESAAAAPQQVRCETGATLFKLAGGDPKTVALINTLHQSGADIATQSLACEQQLRQQIGQSTPAPEVERRHLAGAAYAAFEDFTTSSTLDSGWALSAQLKNLASADQATVLAWLQANQGSDGSFATNGTPDVLATATVLRGLKDAASQNAVAAAVASKAATYLLGRRDAVSQWNDDVASTALIFEAVQPYTGTDPTTATGVASYLLSKQMADGSWADDAFLTAVALRALGLSAQPAVGPDQSGFIVKFVDARNNAALPGVVLTASNSAAINGTSDASGSIQLSALAVGNYQLQASLNGYATLNFSVTLKAGQVLDAGVMQMMVASNSTLAVVTGLVRDQSNNLPVAGATVTVGPQNVSAQTTSDGRYLISSLTPGSITVSVNKTGYTGASSSATAAAGQVFNFSPWLTPTSTPGTAGDCKVQGTVTDAVSQLPVAGVAINLGGVLSQTTLTDASGRFSLSGLVSGLVTLGTAKTGYDAVNVASQIACSLDRSTVIVFSPRLYTTGQSPAGANTSGLSGVVMDARTNQPIANAALVVTPAVGAPVNALSAADGSFRITGLNGASAQVAVSATGYESSTLQFALVPLVVVDVAQIRLRPPKVVQLLPDFKLMAVRRTHAITDAQTLQLTGTVDVDISNVGSQTAAAGASLLAFADLNRNKVFDAGMDTVLGRATLAQSLAPNATVTVQIAVAGVLGFRDAPITVVIDPDNQIAELSKTNNTRSTADGALRAPGNPGVLNPTLKWSWDGASAIYPEFNRVISVPTVGRLVDTNGDGRIDNNDVPVLAFVAYANHAVYGEGVIRIVRGDTGELIRSIRDPALISGATSITLADLDGNGIPDILAATTDRRLIAFRNDGTRMWLSEPAFARDTPGAAITVADINGDGNPMAIFLGNVYSTKTGQFLWHSKYGESGSSYPGQSYISAPVAMDLSGAGKQDVIFGASVYRADGSVKWAYHDGFAAVADMFGDGQPEVVVVNDATLSMRQADGTLLWKVALDSAVGGGPPVIADFDGSGERQIGVSGTRSYSVYRADGTLLWQRPATDASGVTGSTVFDFDGDGRAEVLYADEVSFRVLDGGTGAERFNIPNASGTIIEYPIVADVDGSGRAAMVVVANDAFTASLSPNGVRVFSSPDWVGVRSVWNQHAYSITNINDDLSIPVNPVPNWKADNTFRLNKRTDGDPLAIADLTVGYLRVADGGAAGASTLTLRVGNVGGYRAPTSTPMAVYLTDKAGVRTLLATLPIGTAANAGEYLDLTLPLSNLGNYTTLTAVVDDDGTGKTSIVDFDRSNNTLVADLSAIAVNLHIAVSTDKAAYAATDQAVFTAVVNNQGSFAHDALVRYTLLDAQAHNVAVLPLAGPATVPAGANATVPTLWSAAGTQAGNYQVKAELVTPLGVVYGSATAAFAIQAGQPQANSARITTDRISYTAAQSVQLTALVSNTTANSLQSNLVARTTVLGANAQTVFSQSEAIAQLAAGAQRQYSYNLAATALASGSYSTQLQLLDAQSTVLAQSTGSFSVTSSSQTGVGVSGTLQATPTSVTIGQNVVLALSATNNGNAALLNAPITVTVIDPIAGTVLGTFNNSSSLLPSWAVGATQNLQWTWVANGVANQTVLATATVQVGGNAVSLGQASINLLQPAGPVLVGSVSATPTPAVAGSTVTINASALNQGGTDLSNVALTVSLTDTATHAVVATWPYTANIAKGKSFAMLSSWKATGTAPSNTYIAMLNASVAGQALTLGSSNLVVTVPPVKLTVTQNSLRQGRMLVLLTCRNGEDHYSDEHGDDVRDNDPGDDDDHCNSSRATFLNKLLGSAGIPHLVTSDVDDFVNAMRSGQYNVYWLAGGANKLGNDLAAELREAINRGDGLLLDGIHDDGDKLLDEVVGLQYRGQLEAVNQPILFTMAPLTGKTLQTTGRAIKLKIGNGALVAKFPAGIACHDCDDDDDRHGSSKTDNTAIAGYVYGKGKGVIMAFDLIGSIQNHASDPNWITAIQLAYDFLTPDSLTSFTSGAYAAVRTSVVNTGPTVDLNVTQKLPAGAKALSGDPTATVSANGQQAQWNFNLIAGQSKDLTLYLRLPSLSSTYILDTMVSSLLNGQSTLYGDYTLPLQVTSATDAVATASLIADLKALSVSSNHDRQSRDQAVKAMQDAVAQSRPDSAIRYLLDALGKLSAITTTDVSAYRLRIDLWMQELAFKWQAAQPPRPAH